jgi:hypothetical protein
MTDSDPHRAYRALIDALVHQCREGQGALGRRRAEAGLWNPNATRSEDAEEWEFNELLKALTPKQREVLGRLLSRQFESGVHTALAELHFAELPPFEDGYEGTPFHDFMARLAGWWEWPKGPRGA